MKETEKMFKCLLVNETLWPETETRPRRLAFSPRRDRDRDLPTLCRDRDETETFEKYVSRPSRDRDVETETTTLAFMMKLSFNPCTIFNNVMLTRHDKLGSVFNGKITTKIFFKCKNNSHLSRSYKNELLSH